MPIQRKRDLQLLTLLIFLHVSACSQLAKTTGFRTSFNNMCDETIILDSSGMFFREQGCEGNSKIWFGRYTVSKKGWLHFSFLPIDSLRVVRHIERKYSGNDSTVTVRLIGQKGNPLAFSMIHRAFNRQGWPESQVTDSTGSIIINRKQYTVLILQPLYQLYEQADNLIEGNSDSVNIYFGVPDLFVGYNEIELGEPENLRLKYRKNRLRRSGGHSRTYEVIQFD